MHSDNYVDADRSAVAASGGAVAGLRAFGEDTLILTRRGEIRAGELTDSDQVATRSGEWLDIAWLEHIRLGARFLSDHAEVKPVLICSGELGLGQPKRNVVLSPDQEIWTEDDVSRGRFRAAGDISAQPKLFDATEVSVGYVIFSCSKPTVVSAEGLWVRLDG